MEGFFTGKAFRGKDGVCLSRFPQLLPKCGCWETWVLGPDPGHNVKPHQASLIPLERAEKHNRVLVRESRDWM